MERIANLCIVANHPLELDRCTTRRRQGKEGKVESRTCFAVAAAAVLPSRPPPHFQIHQDDAGPERERKKRRNQERRRS